MVRQQLMAVFSLLHVATASIGNDLGFGKWFRPTLTYKIVQYPEHRRHPRMVRPVLLKEYVDDSLEKAIDVWKPVVPVVFERTVDEDADIKIFFWSGEHRDGYAFDGKGGEVAHTFYPDQPKRGEIHIDDDEPWAPDGRNLCWVLAHELGHALGIPHQRGPSLMQQGYRGYRNRPMLTKIDIGAVRRIYGCKDRWTASQQSSTYPPRGHTIALLLPATHPSSNESTSSTTSPNYPGPVKRLDDKYYQKFVPDVAAQQSEAGLIDMITNPIHSVPSTAYATPRSAAGSARSKISARSQRSRRPPSQCEFDPAVLREEWMRNDIYRKYAESRAPTEYSYVVGRPRHKDNRQANASFSIDIPSPLASRLFDQRGPSREQIWSEIMAAHSQWYNYNHPMVPNINPMYQRESLVSSLEVGCVIGILTLVTVAVFLVLTFVYIKGFVKL